MQVKIASAHSLLSPLLHNSHDRANSEPKSCTWSINYTLDLTTKFCAIQTMIQQPGTIPEEYLYTITEYKTNSVNKQLVVPSLELGQRTHTLPIV